PQEAKASFLSGSKRSASTPSPMGTVVITLPVSAFTTAIILLSQPTKRRRFFLSIARPLGDSQGASGQRDLTFNSFGSSATSSLLSSIFTNSSPSPVLTPNSGLPPSSILPTILPLAASMEVELWLLPLKVKTRFVAGSNRIASGFSPTDCTLLIGFKVLRSK